MDRKTLFAALGGALAEALFALAALILFLFGGCALAFGTEMTLVHLAWAIIGGVFGIAIIVYCINRMRRSSQENMLPPPPSRGADDE